LYPHRIVTGILDPKLRSPGIRPWLGPLLRKHAFSSKTWVLLPQIKHTYEGACLKALRATFPWSATHVAYSLIQLKSQNPNIRHDGTISIGNFMLMMKKPKNLKFELLHPKNVRLSSVVPRISCLFDAVLTITSDCRYFCSNFSKKRASTFTCSTLWRVLNLKKKHERTYFWQKLKWQIQDGGFRQSTFREVLVN
jgi:hypothetical protein